jgi:RHS repeat-associated protein
LSWDTGVATLQVNGPSGWVVAAQASYGMNSTPDSLAAGLALGITGSSPVNIAESNATLYLQSKATGAGSDYAYMLSIVNNANSPFTTPSFQASPASGNLDAGAGAGSGGSVVYSYQIPSYSSGTTPGGYDATGNIVGYSDSVNGTYGALNGTAGFGYDTLNRLISAAGKTAANATAANCWAYDAFGNRTTSYAGPCSDNPAPTAAYYANNRIQSGLVTYDAAGDVTMNSASGGANQYLYDAEGRVCAVQSQAADGVIVMDGYVYDASGARVAKGVISVWSCDPSANGLRTTVDYILGPGGQTATELGDNGKGAMVWQRSYVYAGGQNIAVYDDNGLHFSLTDWLGTLRATTDSAGVVESTCSSLPFGDGQACNGPTDTHHFTGKERDSESGNDYFEARYYASLMGRWMSPDWSAKVEPIPYSKLDNPQTLNLYAYVGNNPMTRFDVDGHQEPGGSASSDNSSSSSSASNRTSGPGVGSATPQPNLGNL